MGVVALDSADMVGRRREPGYWWRRRWARKLGEPTDALARAVESALADRRAPGAVPDDSGGRCHRLDAGTPRDDAPLTPDEQQQDSVGSYYDAIAEIKRRVEAGAPIPTTGYFGRRRNQQE